MKLRRASMHAAISLQPTSKISCRGNRLCGWAGIMVWSERRKQVSVVLIV
jgi:hypothetical protein